MRATLPRHQFEPVGNLPRAGRIEGYLPPQDRSRQDCRVGCARAVRSPEYRPAPPRGICTIESRESTPRTSCYRPVRPAPARRIAASIPAGGLPRRHRDQHLQTRPRPRDLRKALRCPMCRDHFRLYEESPARSGAPRHDCIVSQSDLLPITTPTSGGFKHRGRHHRSG